jgi:ethanolamine utilization microcompartment shell protein EutS
MSYIYTSPGTTVTTVPITVTPNTITYSNTGTGINWGGTMNTGTTGTYTIATDPNIKGASLHVKGNAEFEGDVTFEGDVAIKGKSIKESLEEIGRAHV